MTTNQPELDLEPRTVPRFTQYGTNLTDGNLKSRVIFATDEFFAVADNLLKREDPEFDPNAYCSQGKVMDGWESRRRRKPGHDWCVIRLAYRGLIAGFEVDTAFFTGNFAPRISIQAANIPNYLDDEHDEWMPGSFDRFERGGGIRGSKANDELIAKAQAACDDYEWHTLVPMSNLRPGYQDTRMHYFALGDADLKRIPFTHIRVNYFPDGGVARLKAYGSCSYNYQERIFEKLKPGELPPLMELSSMAKGGRGLACSNKHFGVPRNLLKPGRGIDMGDGWETARHLDRPATIEINSETGLVDTELGDWAILQLGNITECIEKLQIDTCHFKGNYPESIYVEAGCARNLNTTIHDESVDHDDVKFDDLTIEWFPLLLRTKLGPDKLYTFELEKGQLTEPVPEKRPYISHIRVNIYPDGGISRVRAFGRPKRMVGELNRVLSGMRISNLAALGD
jgi:allantoicase